MKTKLFTLLLSMLFIYNINAQCTGNVNIPDATFKAYLLGNSAINTLNDGEISCDEANAFTGNIIIGGLGISDVTGLEAFVNLAQFHCTNTSSTVKLASLDVSANTALVAIYCSYNNLTTIDVSANTALRVLDVNENFLSRIDVSNNPNLTTLACSNNSLVSLNLKNISYLNTTGPSFRSNPNLTCIEVDDVDYANANWGNFKDATASYSLDCNYPCIVGIPDADFKAALLADTTINTDNDTEISCAEALAVETINVSNKSLSSLAGIEAFVNLLELDCSGNSIGSINISANTALKGLNFSNNGSLGTINLSNNTALKTLDVSNNSFSSLNITANINLINLNYSNTIIGDLDVSSHPNLTSLKCSSARLDNLDVSANTALVNLDCSSNNLISLNVANGNNANFTGFDALDNEDLSCIQVDDEAYANSNWAGFKDATASYSSDCSTLSIVNHTLSNALNVYPNPVLNTLHVNLENGETIQEIAIYSVLGKEILKTTHTTIDVSPLTKGIYLLKVSHALGAVATHKIVKN